MVAIETLDITYPSSIETVSEKPPATTQLTLEDLFPDLDGFAAKAGFAFRVLRLLRHWVSERAIDYTCRIDRGYIIERNQSRYDGMAGEMPFYLKYPELVNPLDKAELGKLLDDFRNKFPSFSSDMIALWLKENKLNRRLLRLCEEELKKEIVTLF